MSLCREIIKCVTPKFRVGLDVVKFLMAVLKSCRICYVKVHDVGGNQCRRFLLLLYLTEECHLSFSSRLLWLEDSFVYFLQM